MRHCVVRCAILLAVSTIAVVGCGGPGGGKTASVSGKVTVAGKGVLTGGSITFTPTAAVDKARTGTITKEGTYSVVDLVRGECKVSIDNMSLKTIPVAKGTEIAGMNTTQGVYMPIDAKYAKPETSGLSKNVDSSTVTYDIELK